jgi:hypothetical protein
MDTAAILDRLTELGVTTTVQGDRLRLTPASKIPPDLVEAIKAHKQLLVLAIRPPEALKGALIQKNYEILTMRKRLASSYYADDAEYQDWCKDQIACLTGHVTEIERYLREGGILRLPPCCIDDDHICLIAMRRFDGCLMTLTECGFAISKC